jgi:hypothetical protein
MSVSSTTTKVSYSGDGSQTVFAYTFKIFAAADLRVIERASNGTETVKTLTTHYTVSGVGTDGGGNVTFTTAPASGVTVLIKRNLGLTQGTDYIENDPFPAESHEDALDRLTFIAQNIQEQVDRCIKASETNTLSGAEFTVDATDRANKIFAFDSSGNVNITQEIGTFRGSDATTTTAAYNVRDLIKSTTAAQLNNIYICTATAAVGDLLTDTDHFELLVDAYSAATSATNAAASATTATTKASEAATSATSAETAKTASETAKTASEAAQTAAEAAQAAAETALDTFDDRFLGAKSSDPTVDNDGNALLDGALYFDTANDLMKVYDLTNTQWRQLTLTSSNQTNVNTVAGQISPTNNISTLAGISADITTVAGIGSSDITAVAGVATEVGLLGTSDAVADMNTLGTAAIVADMDALADITANITTVAGISSNVTTVAGDSADIQTLAANIGTIGSKAASGANSDITSLSGLTTALSIAQGGTGATSASAARTALGVGTISTQASDSVSITGGSVTGITDIAVADGGTGASDAATARTNLGLVIGTDVQAYDAGLAYLDGLNFTNEATFKAGVNLEIGTDVQAYDADIVKKDENNTFTKAQRGSTNTDTTNTGSVTLDFDANQNFVLTLTGNVTLANPSTESVGQSGFITFIQDSTGGRTVSLGTDYETAGGAGLTLSSAASTTDIVPYVVVASGRVLLGAPQLAFS